MRHVHALFLSFFSLVTTATEIDNLTHRSTQLRDVSPEVNAIVNGYFSEIITTANQKKSCDEKTFLDLLAKRIGTGFISKIEKEIENDPSLDQAFTKRRNSIYRDFRFYEAPGIFFTSLASLININGILIGTDKLGHFLGTGYAYYKRMHYKGKTHAQVLKYGERTERTYYGLMLNGVYSYADLAANIDGLSFWERVLGTSEQTKVLAPYVRCENNQWVQNAEFYITDYINNAWDEGTNCNRYRNKRMHKKVVARISEVEASSKLQYQCRISQEECSTLIARYGDSAHSVLTQECFRE